jgi:Lrp/AsnC family transcriptional regulator for asnA, asnC and gidA
MGNLDQYDILIIKELEKDGRMAYSTIAANLKISNTMVHQRVNRLMEQGILLGIKPVINEKKVGYDWGSFTGITLNKDQDSTRIIEELKKIPEITECYYISGSVLKITNICENLFIKKSTIFRGFQKPTP